MRGVDALPEARAAPSRPARRSFGELVQRPGEQLVAAGCRWPPRARAWNVRCAAQHRVRGRRWPGRTAPPAARRGRRRYAAARPARPPAPPASRAPRAAPPCRPGRTCRAAGCTAGRRGSRESCGGARLGDEAAAGDAAGGDDQVLAGQQAQRLAYGAAARPRTGRTARGSVGSRSPGLQPPGGDLGAEVVGEHLVRRRPRCLPYAHGRHSLCGRDAPRARLISRARRRRRLVAGRARGSWTG